jgi:hypothetical protein
MRDNIQRIRNKEGIVICPLDKGGLRGIKRIRIRMLTS